MYYVGTSLWINKVVILCFIYYVYVTIYITTYVPIHVPFAMASLFLTLVSPPALVLKWPEPESDTSDQCELALW